MATTSTIKAALDEIAERIQTNSKRLQAARQSINAGQADLAAMPAAYSAIIAEINAQPGTDPFVVLSKDEATKLTAEQFGSALLNQYPVVYGRSGHSMVGEDLVYDADRRAFFCRTCDSYGGTSRDGTGRIYDSERRWATGGAWACRVVTMPDEV